jgi:hypothetical protein
LPFETLPIPGFDHSNAIHVQLARLSLRCHRQVAEMVRSNPDLLQLPVGRARRLVRESIAAQLREIAQLTGRLVGLRTPTDGTGGRKSS